MESVTPSVIPEVNLQHPKPEPYRTSKSSVLTKELWLLLSLFGIAAVLNLVVESERMVLAFYFLPTLFSAYLFGRRHATLTAVASVLLALPLVYFNYKFSFLEKFAPTEMFQLQERWFDFVIWAGLLVVTGYCMGTLYERDQDHLRQLRESYHGILLILQHFASSDKYSQDHAFRVSICATRIAEAMGLDSDRVEDLRAAALLHNVDQLGINREILNKASSLTREETRRGRSPLPGSSSTGGSLRRVLPLVVCFQERVEAKADFAGDELPIEVRILAVADSYETLTAGRTGKPFSPTHAEDELLTFSGTHYDSNVVDAFIRAVQQRPPRKMAATPTD
jgi:HD domain